MPAIFSIPAGLPFLDTLVAGLPPSDGDPLALTRTTILLPTRRAARSLSDAFLRASAGRALLLPRLVPVGDLAVEDLVFAGEDDGAAIEILPALPPLRRQLLLTRLVLKFAEQTTGALAPGQAAPLARELARFLDEVQTARGDFAALKSLAPDQFATHWQQVLRFLGIVTEHWPAQLAAEGGLDPAERRNRVLAARIAAWEKDPPRDPVITAGLIGGVAAVADIVAAVAQLPCGTVVLPGLDLTTTDRASIAADPTHPQHLMARLLDRLGIAPDQVSPWPGCESAISPRATLIRAALAPASESDRWRGITGVDDRAIAHLRRIDCPGAREEAEVVALLMRQCLETERTAALVTPDRALARRVAAELKRWNIEIDDSAGTPLAKTPPVVFLRLLLEAAVANLAPLPLLACLKHPLAAGGFGPGVLRAQTRRLEEKCLRGPRPATGLAGLRATVAANVPDLMPLVGILERAFAPLIGALGATSSLPDLIAAHVAAAEALAARDDGTGAENLWREEAGEAAAQFMAEFAEAAQSFPLRAGADYPALFEALLVGPVVRPRYGGHPRLAIWGLLEARLQQADLMILGGLNEEVWPPRIETDAFLSRPMRHSFGLPQPEERVGVAAHDFAQALAAPEVVLTRATRIEGTPTVPSRWLLRLDAVLRAAGLEGKIAAVREPLQWQAMLDAPGARQSIRQPEPRPPAAIRPRQLSVTQIETLIRDPYSVYARAILRLKKLEPIDAAPDAADRGTFIHHALDAFLKLFPDALPDDVGRRLLAIGRARFEAELATPELRAFWWPRFERVVHWFVEQERERRGAIAETRSEITGRLEWRSLGGPFLLTATADRIDRLRDGDLRLVDYKTGSLPRKSEWMDGYAPQLPLEAAIAEAGGFNGIAAGNVGSLEYWRLSGRDPPGEIKPLADNGDLRALIVGTLPGVKQLVAKFDDETTPYVAVPRADYAPRYNDFEHLARIKEWLAAEDEDE